MNAHSRSSEDNTEAIPDIVSSECCHEADVKGLFAISFVTS